jgi:hypothetical protein
MEIESEQTSLVSFSVNLQNVQSKSHQNIVYLDAPRTENVFQSSDYKMIDSSSNQFSFSMN